MRGERRRERRKAGLDRAGRNWGLTLQRDWSHQQPTSQLHRSNTLLLPAPTHDNCRNSVSRNGSWWLLSRWDIYILLVTTSKFVVRLEFTVRFLYASWYRWANRRRIDDLRLGLCLHGEILKILKLRRILLVGCQFPLHRRDMLVYT